jgi:hypothetical protein
MTVLLILLVLVPWSIYRQMQVNEVTGWFPGEHAGEIFVFIAVSFAAQNLVVARRTQGTLVAPAPTAG